MLQFNVKATVIRKIQILLFIFLCNNQVVAQKLVDAIEFNGNERTKKEILLKYIKSSVHHCPDSTTIKTDVQRLLNMRVFSTVDYQITERNDSLILTFNCKEIITSFPVFSFGTIGTNSFYKAGYINANVFGKLGILKLNYQYYDGHSFYFNQEIPYLNWSNFGIKLELKKVSTLEPIYFENTSTVYKYDNNFGGLDAFYEFKPQHRLFFGAAYFSEQFTVQETDTVLNMSNDLMLRAGNKFMIKGNYSYASVNFNTCYVDGFANQVYAGLTFSSQYPLFFQFYNVTKVYKTFKHKANLALRFKAGISSNNVGPFSPFALDSYLNIRGVGSKVDRGTSQVVLNLEYRQSIIENKIIVLQTVLFNDMGVWRHSGNTFQDFLLEDNFKIFSGLGVRIFTPVVYNLVLRVDYGVNLLNFSNSGVVIGIGQYF